MLHCYGYTTLVRCIVSPCSLLSLLFLFPFSTVDVLLLVFFNCFNFSLALPPLCLGYTTSVAYLNVHKFSFVCYRSLNLFSSYINYPKFLASHFISICIAMRDTRKKNRTNTGPTYNEKNTHQRAMDLLRHCAVKNRFFKRCTT